MNRKTILLGEAPNRATVERPELWLLPDKSGTRHTANRLLEYSGLTHEQYMHLLERRNLLGRACLNWPILEARAAAAQVAHEFRMRDVIILGTRVREAMAPWLVTAPPFQWIEPNGRGFGRTSSCCRRVAWMWHPSGRSGKYSKPKAREACAGFFAALLEEKTIGEGNAQSLRSLSAFQSALRQAFG